MTLITPERRQEFRAAVRAVNAESEEMVSEDIMQCLSATNWRHIVIHHSCSHDAPGLNTQDIRRWHTSYPRNWLDIGYHFIIENVNGCYEVICGRFLDKKGAHKVSRNSSGIGICLVGNYDVTVPPPEQLELAQGLVRSLQTAFCIGKKQVEPHYPGLKGCPGKFFPWETFVKGLIDEA